jgi:hypothetical protein
MSSTSTPPESVHKLARLYMSGRLDKRRYARGSGVYCLMRLADKSPSGIAVIRALEALTKLARLDEPDGNAEDTLVMLCEIGVVNNQIVELAPPAETQDEKGKDSHE